MAPAREMTDQDLIRTYVDSQDVESLGVFFCRYKGPLMRFVSNFLQDESAAQAIVQETFLRIVRKPARLLDVNSCLNGLLKIALNLSIGHLRRSVRKKKLTGSMKNGASLTAATSNDLNESGAYSPGPE